MISLTKGEDSMQDNLLMSSSSSKASTNDNSNSNCSSDVEIIEDDYAKSLQSIAPLSHAKSTIITNQTTIDHQRLPFGLQKLHSTYSTSKHHHHHNCDHDHFDDCSSTFTGEATRSTMKRKFVNKEERFEFN